MTNELEKEIDKLIELRRCEYGSKGDEIQLLIIALIETVLPKRKIPKYLENVRKLFDL